MNSAEAWPSAVGASQVLHHRIVGETQPGLPTLVLIHGFGGSHRWWNRIVPLLEPRHMLIVDLLGHGSSPRSVSTTNGRLGADEYSPAAHAAAVHDLLDKYEIDHAVPIGHSMGFDVALALAERLSSTTRVSAMVGLDEGPTPECATFPKGHNLVRSPLLGPLLKAISPNSAVMFGYRTAFAPGYAVDSELRRMLIEDYRAQPFDSFRKNLDAKTDYAHAIPFDRRIEALGLPTLMIFGGRDQLWSPQMSIARYTAVPNVQLHTIRESGHTPIIEAPDDTATRITAFLDSYRTTDD
ncbi:alpha/beta fold hydrolase [Rhodococcus qingshengii]|uniref:alpha/beta fold hydrolase n=1 Tax=Rhodococcus qingshengii TaxID=334542 RepID=UPI00237D00C5|nr:alpha/beta hydrolase [Rhodococcus qingshengii]WCT05832.1 alpha/beta hydrolase [Rhodococcus qingshengii]